MKLRQTFSNFHVDSINVAAPVLPFTLTVELVQEDGAVPFSFTIPGCLYVPLDEGEDGQLGKFQRPANFSRKGRKIPRMIIGPTQYVRGLEKALRADKEVQQWEKRLKAALGRDPLNRVSKQMEFIEKANSL